MESFFGEVEGLGRLVGTIGREEGFPHMFQVHIGAILEGIAIEAEGLGIFLCFIAAFGSWRDVIPGEQDYVNLVGIIAILGAGVEVDMVLWFTCFLGALGVEIEGNVGDTDATAGTGWVFLEDTEA